MNSWVILLLLLLLIIPALPVHSYSQNWGPYPAGGLTIVVVILIVLILLGKA